MWVGLLFRGCEKEWGRKTLLRWLLNIAAILHWSLKPILHSLEQWTSWLRLPPSHQGDIIYIMRRCHGNKAPISTGVVSHGGWIPRCLPNMRSWCAGSRSIVKAVTHSHTETYALSPRGRIRAGRHAWLENKGWEGNSKWAVLWGGVGGGFGGVCCGHCKHVVCTLHLFMCGLVIWCMNILVCFWYLMCIRHSVTSICLKMWQGLTTWNINCMLFNGFQVPRPFFMF